MMRATRLRACEKTALLFGRAIFGGFFLYNGINHFKNREMMAAYASSNETKIWSCFRSTPSSSRTAPMPHWLKTLRMCENEA